MEQVNALDKMFEYSLWANLQIIEVCSQLDEQQLEVEVKGVYGRIHSTLMHLISAEGYYVIRLTGTDPFPEVQKDNWDSVDFAQMAELVQKSGSRLVEIASSVDASHFHSVDVPWQEEKFTFFNWTVILQALYHAIEHRTQIKILLTQLGVEHPELAAWDYTESLTA